MNSSKLAPRAPKNPKNALATLVQLRLLPDEIAKTDHFASQEIRSRSAFVRMIFLRGLEAYERELAAAQ
jgi:hypothetical protein